MPTLTLPSSRERLRDVPLPITLLLLTMMVPRELEFQFGVALTPQRLVLLLFLPLAFLRLVTSRTITLRSFDLLLIGAFAYFWLALFAKETMDKAFQSGSSQFLEAVGGYLVARVYIRSSLQFRATVQLLFVLVLLAGAAAMVESVSHTHWLKELARLISGAAPTWVTDTRMGLMRAAVTFDHPIHYGVFCVGVFALVWFVARDVTARAARATLVGIALFFSLSSAPLMGMGLVLAADIWERLTRSIPHRVWSTAAGVFTIYVLMTSFTNRSPTRILSTSFVFDQESAYYRLAIWEYGSESVLNHPWFGTPLGTWERPDWMYSATVDHYWLLTAMSGGIPAVVLYISAIVILLRIVNIGRHRLEPVEQRQCRYAWTAAVLALCFLGTTVAFWRETEVFFTFCLGMGAALSDLDAGSRKNRRHAGTPKYHPSTISEMTR